MSDSETEEIIFVENVVGCSDPSLESCELPVTKIDVSLLQHEEVGCVCENVEKEETLVERLSRCVAKDQLIPGSMSLRDTSLKGPGICMFKYCPTKTPDNFGYFFIKKGSELWNEYERAYPRIGELYNQRRNPHDIICIGVTLDTKKPLSEEIAFSYYSFHTHDLLLML